MSILDEIANKQTVHDKVHESVYRSYSALELVKQMLERGDSHETILLVIDHIEKEPNH